MNLLIIILIVVKQIKMCSTRRKKKFPRRSTSWSETQVRIQCSSYYRTWYEFFSATREHSEYAVPNKSEYLAPKLKRKSA